MLVFLISIHLPHVFVKTTEEEQRLNHFNYFYLFFVYYLFYSCLRLVLVIIISNYLIIKGFELLIIVNLILSILLN